MLPAAVTLSSSAIPKAIRLPKDNNSFSPYHSKLANCRRIIAAREKL
jgi:hypothetical protein